MLLFGALAAFTLLPGCGGDSDADHAEADHGDADHADHADEDGHENHADHDAGDDHPEHGPNDGHIVAFDDGLHHAEWIDKKDEEKVIVLMLDDKKKSTTIPADAKMTITTTPKDVPAKTFSLAAVEPADGKASKFESSDKSIGAEIGIAHEAEGKIMLSVEIEGKTINAELVPHEH
jgi:hypothetical protein